MKFLILAIAAIFAAPTAQADSISVSSVETIVVAGESTIVTSWKDAKGVEHEVATTRKAGESLEDFADRHFKAVDEAQKKAPPVPDQQ